MVRNKCHHSQKHTIDLMDCFIDGEYPTHTCQNASSSQHIPVPPTYLHGPGVLVLTAVMLHNCEPCHVLGCNFQVCGVMCVNLGNSSQPTSLVTSCQEVWVPVWTA